MTALQKVEALLPEMNKVEKAQLLQWVVSDLSETYPGIEKTSGICGGDARITRTRIPIWSLVNSRNLGLTEEELLHEFPALTAEDLRNAWNYYRANKEEVDAQIFENEEV